MDDKIKNRFDSISTLWKGAWEQFNERRKYEFQISLAVWTALASFTALILTRNEITFKADMHKWAGLGLAIIFIIYTFWRHNLTIANRKDKKIAFHYENLMQTLSDSKFDLKLKKDLAPNKWSEKFSFLGWSPISQILITALLCFASYLAVLYRS